MGRGATRASPATAPSSVTPTVAAVLVELAEPLGKQSNNVAEYSGLLAGLRAVVDLDPSADVVARMDSKLVVEQMSGRWKIKHEDMRRLALEARDLCAEIGDAGGSRLLRVDPAREEQGRRRPEQRRDGRQVRPPGAPRRAGRGRRRLRGVAAQADSSVSWSPPRRPAGGAATRPLRLLLVQAPLVEAAVPRVVGGRAAPRRSRGRGRHERGAAWRLEVARAAGRRRSTPSRPRRTCGPAGHPVRMPTRRCARHTARSCSAGAPSSS